MTDEHEHEREERAEKTLAAEEADASARHEADRMPTPDEEEAAEAAESSLYRKARQDGVTERYEEALERGVGQRGEGRIE